MAKRTAKPFPDRKISETFLLFAAPGLDDLPLEEPERQARHVLKVCFMVWNAVVFADVLDDPRHLDNVRRSVAGNPKLEHHIESLIARKRELFADDARLIGDWKTTRTKDGFNLRAESRDPYALSREK